jgi:hypothetical protein
VKAQEYNLNMVTRPKEGKKGGRAPHLSVGRAEVACCAVRIQQVCFPSVLVNLNGLDM